MQYDKNFLKELYRDKNKIIYARVTALTFDESPIETIEGRVTQGSINVDGTSAVRRSCSLTLVAQDYDYRDYLWGLKTKFKLEIGLKNNISSIYPDVIWFEQGIFLITSLNTSSSANNFTMQISGKDKMCLLNGEISGSLNASVDFGTMEIENTDGTITIKKIPIEEIIREMVHQYAGEPYHNIILNDLDILGLELLEYRYDTPMFLYRATNSYIYNNVTLDGNKVCKVMGEVTTLKEILEKHPLYFETLTESFNDNSTAKIITIDNNDYYVAAVTYGQTAGYRKTDLVYPTDLIAAVGESLTSVLDKIKNVLGEFEYFYDIYGRFVFQKKTALVNTFWTPKESENESSNAETQTALAAQSNYSYMFNEGELITAFNNNPNIQNLKNDYSIWGTRVSVAGAEIPIHLRYVIDTKPTKYVTIAIEKDSDASKAIRKYNEKYKTNLAETQNPIGYAIEDYDWREIIYRMAMDYFKYAHILNDFTSRVATVNQDMYPTGMTGYEQYYIDLQSFWRELYNPEEQNEDFYTVNEENKFWNKNVFEAPEKLNFWFDFLDTQGELSNFNVKNIGFRSKPINDTNIKSIYFRETPSVIYITDQSESTNISSYREIQVGNIDMMFSISSQGLSAKDKLDELIYQHGYCIDSATITTIPIYDLQPNTRIYVYDNKTNLEGDYIVSKLSIPLTYNGTMQITATKAANSIVW